MIKYVTGETARGVLHYTCNSPKEEVCKRNGIKMVWEDYGKQAREFLLIPKKLFEKKWKEISACGAESLMVELTKKK